MNTKLIYVFASLVLLLQTACNSKKEQALIKRWYVSDVVFLDDAKSIVQSDTMQGNMLQRQRAALKDVLMKNLYEFKDDGTYITGNAAGSATGEWELNSSSITFKSDTKDKPEKNISFEHLSEDSLVLLLNKDQTSVKMKLILLPAE
jgi:hypothetical protein